MKTLKFHLTLRQKFCLMYIILSFSCFSQARERVNGDASLYDSLDIENYNNEIIFLEDSVKITVCRDYSETVSDGSFYHIVENKSEQNLVIFFIEEENDTLPQVKLLRRKLYRRYGDFYFFMIEWEANMCIEKSPTVTPDLFVKVLRPEDKFELVVPYSDKDEEQTASKVSRHLLACSKTLFSSDEIGMPHFIENLLLYDIVYDNTKIVISADAFKSFFSKYQ